MVLASLTLGRAGKFLLYQILCIKKEKKRKQGEKK